MLTFWNLMIFFGGMLWVGGTLLGLALCKAAARGDRMMGLK